MFDLQRLITESANKACKFIKLPFSYALALRYIYHLFNKLIIYSINGSHIAYSKLYLNLETVVHYFARK